MLERLVEQRKAINLYSVQRGSIDSLSNAEWELAERIVKILKPIYSATLEICADDACISVVIPLVSNLINAMEITTADQGLKQMKAALRDSINRRFSEIRSAAPFVGATLLDPRFKDTYFSAQEKILAKKVVLDFLQSVHSQSAEHETAASESVGPALEGECSEASDIQEEDLWAAHDSQPDSVNLSQGDSQSDVIPLYEKQLTSYLSEPRLPRMKTDIYAYWHLQSIPTT